MSANSERSSTPGDVEQQTYTLTANLHARPAAQLAQTAARFESEIAVAHGGRSANPHSVLSLMGLGATSGGAVTITAHGADAEAAVSALIEVLAAAR